VKENCPVTSPGFQYSTQLSSHQILESLVVWGLHLSVSTQSLPNNQVIMVYVEEGSYPYLKSLENFGKLICIQTLHSLQEAFRFLESSLLSVCLSEEAFQFETKLPYTCEWEHDITYVLEYTSLKKKAASFGTIFLTCVILSSLHFMLRCLQEACFTVTSASSKLWQGLMCMGYYMDCPDGQ